MSDLLPQPVEAERPRWRRRLVQYWWLWGFAMIPLALWLGLRWHERVSSFERQFVGTWKMTSSDGINYYVLTADRRCEQWWPSSPGLSTPMSLWKWAANPDAFEVQYQNNAKLFSGSRAPDWKQFPILSSTKDKIVFANFRFERIPQLPPEIAAAREKWLRKGAHD